MEAKPTERLVTSKNDGSQMNKRNEKVAYKLSSQLRSPQKIQAQSSVDSFDNKVIDYRKDFLNITNSIGSLGTEVSELRNMFSVYTN